MTSEVLKLQTLAFKSTAIKRSSITKHLMLVILQLFSFLKTLLRRKKKRGPKLFCLATGPHSPKVRRPRQQLHQIHRCVEGKVESGAQGENGCGSKSQQGFLGYPFFDPKPNECDCNRPLCSYTFSYFCSIYLQYTVGLDETLSDLPKRPGS